MSEKKPTPFRFGWPTSEIGSRVMGWLLAVTGVLLFVKGCIDRRLPDYNWRADRVAEVVILYVGFGLFSWWLIFNVFRLVYSHVMSNESIRKKQETRDEKAELEALRRRSEIKKLKEELGDATNGPSC